MISREIERNLSGTHNAGKFLITFTKNKEEAPNIQAFPITDADKQYEYLSREATSQIIVAHRVTSPLLMGVRTDGNGLGSNTDEYTWWYHKFKHFDFQGWAIGGPQKLVDFMFAVSLMLKEREFENERLEYVHLLGISKISDLQLGFYKVGVEEMLGVKVNLGNYWMSRESGTGEMIDLSRYTKDMLEYFVDGFDKARKAGIFLPNLQSCSFCGLTEHCQFTKGK